MHHTSYQKLLSVTSGLFLLIVFNSDKLSAQPSGGPYGPVRQTYELPDCKGKIYYVAPDGKANDKGLDVKKPTTMESAFERVVSGDAIVMRGGTYRTGNLKLNQGVIIQPYQDEQPVIKGTYIASDWEDLGNGLWKTSWTHLFPSEPQDWWRRERHGKITPQHRFNNDMVFIDNKFLQSAGWEGEVDENSYYIDYKNKMVYIGTDPTDKLVEITAFNVGIHRVTGQVHGKQSDGKGPVIRGITLTQYAYRALEVEGTEPQGISAEKDHGKAVIGTTLEHCLISYCSRVAAYFRGDSLIVRNSKITDTSTEGLYIIASSDVLLEKNIFTRNNIERFSGYFPAAVKIFNQTYRVTCNDNLVIDLPYSNGIWYDVGNHDGVFINNWVENVGYNTGDYRQDQLWPSDNGFFFEISQGAICAGNVFVNCDHGLMILNSSDVHMYQNTFVNSMACIGRDQRSAEGDHFGWHPSTGPDVDERDGHIFVNNLLTGNEHFKRALLFVWQRAMLCDRLKESQFKQMDNNVYIRKNTTSHPLILWSPAKNQKCQYTLGTPEELHQLYPGYETKSTFVNNYDGSIFKSAELKNFQLVKPIPGTDAMTIPPEILNLLSTPLKKIPFVGAYPQD